MNNVSKKTKDLAKLGILGAISIVLIALVRVPIIPAVPFLIYDPADVPIMIATFAMGPLAGFGLTVAVSVIQGTLMSTDGFYGILMHIIATGTFVLVAGNIYKRHKTKKGAIISLLCGVIAWVAVMALANLIITPMFLGMPVSVVVKMLGWIVLFNLIKSLLNSAITFLVYKRVSGILHK
ncbi:MAG TPA: ECF transporter S component [Bacillota bacterium]|nr:ECF transporter S component [Bacillota bacterium]HQC36204.1 ECF transporter S component [Bacillota bacterium]